jgi:precorrin-2 dehydrogenase/sirohydrochlorin ferrochelatase
MDAFPAFIPLSGRIVVVAGEGEPAQAKARLFEGSPARVRLIPPEQAEVPDAYASAALAFVALPGAAADRAAAAARASGVLVNVVDRPELCDFTTPAIIDRGAVVGAVGTGGAAPVLATLLRAELEALWPADLGERATLARALQPELRARLPDPKIRRAFLRELLRGAPRSLETARSELDTFVAPCGRVVTVNAGGPAENLRVRDLRVLAAADVVWADPGCDPAVVAFARRDARRPRALPEAEAQALAQAGEMVVLCRASPTP